LFSTIGPNGGCLLRPDNRLSLSRRGVQPKDRVPKGAGGSDKATPCGTGILGDGGTRPFTTKPFVSVLSCLYSSIMFFYYLTSDSIVCQMNSRPCRGSCLRIPARPNESRSRISSRAAISRCYDSNKVPKDAYSTWLHTKAEVQSPPSSYLSLFYAPIEFPGSPETGG